MEGGKREPGVSEARKRSLIAIVLALVVVGLILGVIISTSDTMEPVVKLVNRWFFALFCSLFAIAQLRVYQVRRRQQARLATHVPVAAFGIFAAIWVLLAIVSFLYGAVGLGRSWETAGWITIVLIICIQQLVLGKLTRSSES
ncbi:MAG: hypothetical protein JSU87_08780 [Gemmatimonadota bacterium]|nr:MAG: hypothetical protein JSU87_08780 [Gemmatimonadota bacterium]